MSTLPFWSSVAVASIRATFRLPVATKLGAAVGEGVGAAVWLAFGVLAGVDGPALELAFELAHPARLAITTVPASARPSGESDGRRRRAVPTVSLAPTKFIVVIPRYPSVSAARSRSALPGPEEYGLRTRAPTE
jgi:hypothetical protein